MSNAFELTASVPQSAELTPLKTPIGTKNITTSGTYDVAAYASANVQVPQPSGSAPDITANGTYDVTDYETVKAALPFEQKTVTPSASQQTVTPSAGYAALSEVTVNAAPLETKTITPTTQSQTVTPTSPNIGFSSVTVEGYTPPAPIEEKDVNFYDYDGTLLYSYTKAEALALTELPTAPTHEGLTFQEWNYTLSSVSRMVGKNYKVDVGATYITNTGHTRLYMHLENDSFLQPVLSLSVSNVSLTVDWGDGTTPDTITSNSNISHTWNINTFPTDMIIDIAPSGSGSFGFSGNIFNSSVVPQVYRNMLTKIEVGTNITGFQWGIFNNCINLKNIIIPNTVTGLGQGSFNICFSLKYIVLPKGMTDSGKFSATGLQGVSISDSITVISGTAFYSCNNLNKLVLPDSVITISSQAFDNCYRCKFINCLPDGVTTISSTTFSQCQQLEKIVIPSTVQTIGTAAFNNCTALNEIDLSEFSDPMAIPTLDNANALQNTPATQVILVKNAEMLTAFSNATNWSTYADRFQIKS